MTPINKPVRRRTIGAYRGRRLVVSFEPGDVIGVRLERTRKTEYLSLAGVYEYAVKARVAFERRVKIEAKRKGKA